MIEVQPQRAVPPQPPQGQRAQAEIRAAAAERRQAFAASATTVSRSTSEASHPRSNPLQPTIVLVRSGVRANAAYDAHSQSDRSIPHPLATEGSQMVVIPGHASPPIVPVSVTEILARA